MFKRSFLALFLYITFVLPAAAGENLFYILHSHQPDAISEIQAATQHLNKGDVLVQQAYHINGKGDVTGFVNADLLANAKQRGVKVLAMVTNSNFDQQRLHQFLSSSSAEKSAIAFLIEACEENKLDGVQFDFEMVSVKDKEALTQFIKLAANEFHKHHLLMSVAVIPALSDSPGPSAFLRKTYENWSGAYDLKAIGKAADFVTVMAYNQHAEGTTPGPAAGIRWVEVAILHALKYIPAEKISLGIPSYSLYWYTGAGHANHVLTQRIEISFKDADKLIKKNNSKLAWNEKDKVNFAVYEHNWLNEYIYVEDADSFKSKLMLAKKFSLRGVSVFRIGTEDQRIWALLKKKSTLI